jgi:hypothetical protein
MSADTQDDVSDFARYQRPHKTLAIIQQQKWRGHLAEAGTR